MNSLVLRAGLLLSALLLLPCSDADAGNIIDLTYGAGAGSFELGNFVDGGGIPNASGPGYMGVAPGDGTTITNWTVGGPGDGVDWLISPRFRADTGVHSIDLQHLTNSSIATTIPTVAGLDYVLSFAVAAPIGAGNTGRFTAGSLVDVAFTVPFGGDFATQTLTTLTYQFTAFASSTTIRFTGTGAESTTFRYGPVIDTVSVSVVPEPSTFVSAALGLVGLAGYARWRRPGGARA